MRDDSAFPDAFIEKGLTLLLIFTPLAMGTVQRWSAAVMEILAFGLFGLLMLKNIRGASAAPGSGPGSARTRTPFVLAMLFAAFLCLVLLQLLPLPKGLLGLLSPASLALGENAGGSFQTISINPDATLQEMLKVLAYAAVFFVVISHWRTKEQVRSLASTILYTAGFIAVFAMVQKITWNGRLYWFYPLDEVFQSSSRIWGPYLNRNHFAGYMELAIPLGLGLLTYAAPHASSLPGVPAGKRLARFFASRTLVPFTLLFLLLLILSATLLMSLSRGGITGLGLSALFFVWITRRRRSLRRSTGLIALFAAAMALLLLAAAWDRVEERFEDIKREQDVHRLRLWEESLPVVRDFPLLGSGLGTYEQAYMRRQKTKPLLLFDHAHNDYLELLTDTGAAGLLLVLGAALFFFTAVYRAWRRNHGMFGKCVGAGGLASLVAMGVHSLTDFNLHIPANALLFSAVCGITYAAVCNVPRRGDEEDKGGETGGMSREKVIASYLLLLGSLALLYFPLRDLAADYYYGRVEALLDDKTTDYLDARPVSPETLPDYLAAIESLEKARAIHPSRALYAGALSGLYLRLGRWAQAMDSLKAPLPAGALPAKAAFGEAERYGRLAVRLEPANPDYHLALGQFLGEVRGDPGQADAEIGLALQAYPASVQLRYAAALYYLRQKRAGDALEQARITAGLDDSYLLPESSGAAVMKEQRPDGYMDLLYRSYLFAALEIAWQASGDLQVVKGLAPDNPGARDVVNAFIEAKGLE